MWNNMVQKDDGLHEHSTVAETLVFESEEESLREEESPSSFRGLHHSMRLWIKVALILAVVMAVVAFVACSLSPSKHSEGFQDIITLADANPQDLTDLAVVKAFYVAWRAGRFSGVNARHELEKFYAQDIVCDDSADMKNTDIFKIYRGINGGLEEMKNFQQLQLSDFQFTLIPGGAGKVFAQHSYTPTLISTGNTGSKMSDTLAYTVKGGKLSAYKIFFGNVAGLDKLFDAHAPIAVVKGFFAAIAAGKFVGSSSHLEMAKFVAEDAVFDNSADMNNTKIFKTYKGIVEMLQCLKNFYSGRLQLHNEVAKMAQGPDGVVYVYDSYTAVVNDTGKTSPMSDMESWTVKNGKIVHVKIFWGSPGVFDKLFVK